MKSLFVLDSTVREFEGRMLELHSQISMDEWEEVVSNTIAYVAFMESSRDIGCPALEIEWSKENAETLKKLTASLNRMRDIDPLLFAKLNQVDYKSAYTGKMKKNAPEVVKMADEMRKAMYTQKYGSSPESGENTEIYADL